MKLYKYLKENYEETGLEKKYKNKQKTGIDAKQLKIAKDWLSKKHNVDIKFLEFLAVGVPKVDHIVDFYFFIRDPKHEKNGSSIVYRLQEIRE